ncbi:hypothetical protein ACFWB0_06090 [Rhodococcus sp. NPDC060086]|uniref:hypothetical protein n=1 Tax=Rhodococcus sp. NPDC060086 TaxID=3347055 RepID=UPI0036662E9C
MPRAVQTLLHLDEDGTAALDARRVAHICGHDRNAILGYLRISKEQELEWRVSADEATADGDSEEADACNHEAEGWLTTYGQLRGALGDAVPSGNGVCRYCDAE